MDKNLGRLIGMAYRMRRVPRWQNKDNEIEDNIALHTLHSLYIADALVSIHINLTGQSVDRLKVLQYCLYHDVNKTIVGDVVATTKFHSEETRKAMEIINKNTTEQIINMIPNSFLNHYIDAFKLDRNSLEYKLSEASNKLDAYIKSKQEIYKKNVEYYTIANNIQEIIYEQFGDLESVTYFMENCITYVINPEKE